MVRMRKIKVVKHARRVDSVAGTGLCYVAREQRKNVIHFCIDQQYMWLDLVVGAMPLR